MGLLEKDACMNEFGPMRALSVFVFCLNAPYTPSFKKESLYLFIQIYTPAFRPQLGAQGGQINMILHLYIS